MADKTFPYKAVIFDMDGVIVDTEAYYQREQRRFVNEMGLNVSDQEIWTWWASRTKRFSACWRTGGRAQVAS